MIIDTHVHIGTIMNFDMPPKMVIESMEKYGIDFSLISNIGSVEYDHQHKPIPKIYQKSQKDSLIESLEFAKKYPDKIGVCPFIKPATETADDSLRELISKNREMIYAIKVHPFHSITACDDDKMIPYVELAQEFELPIVVHTGGCEQADEIHVYNMAKRYKKVPFVMVHMGLGTDNRKAMELLFELDNLYGDTTWVPMSSIIEIVKKNGAKKIVFGSDNPIDGVDTYYCNKKGDRSLYQDYFFELQKYISKEDYDDIMYRNAEKLFKINK